MLAVRKPDSVVNRIVWIIRVKWQKLIPPQHLPADLHRQHRVRLLLPRRYRNEKDQKRDVHLLDARERKCPANRVCIQHLIIPSAVCMIRFAYYFVNFVSLCRLRHAFISCSRRSAKTALRRCFRTATAEQYRSSEIQITGSCTGRSGLCGW